MHTKEWPTSGQLAPSRTFLHFRSRSLDDGLRSKPRPSRHPLLAMLSAAAFLGSAVPSTVEVCPGEGPRYGDFKCNHDGTHRVCAQLVDNVTHAPLKWGTGDFWDLTGQKAFEWSDRIVAAPNPGDSWCICMWATASLIKQAGCDNVHLRCDSTDVAYVLNQ